MSSGVSSPRTNPQQPTLLRVCRIGRAQGLKGEVNVMSFTDDPDTRFAPNSILLTTDGREFVVERSRNFKARWIIKFESVNDRTAAEGLNGLQLYIEPDAASNGDDDIDDEAYYLSDLIGLTAQLADGTHLGTVHDAIDRPGQSLLEIAEPRGSLSLVPFVEQIVPDVDLDAGTVTLDPPAGLLQEFLTA